MTKIKLVLLTALIVALWFGFSSCKKDDDKEPEKNNTEQPRTDGISTENPSDESKTDEQLKTGKITINFNLSDGIGSISSQIVEIGQKITLPSGEDIKKEGYVFKGWIAPGSGEIITEYIVTDQDVTLYAVWNQVYEAKFDTNGGVGLFETQIVENGSKVIEPVFDPKKTGYMFKGWYIGDSEFDFNTKVRKPLELKAVWEKLFYFSVSSSKKVIFSPGNLQYNPNKKVWRFAEHQYDRCFNTDNYNVAGMYSEYYDGWIDLLGWGRWLDGTDESDIIYYLDNCYSPEVVSDDKYGYSYSFAHNKTTIDNVEWETMSYGEWAYLFSQNNKEKWGLAEVAGVPGIIILPDEWDMPDGVKVFENSINSYDLNKYNAESWFKMEKNGAVFLPAAGERYIDNTHNGSLAVSGLNIGRYWTSNPENLNCAAYIFYFCPSTQTAYTSMRRSSGGSVRLVRVPQN